MCVNAKLIYFPILPYIMATKITNEMILNGTSLKQHKNEDTQSYHMRITHVSIISKSVKQMVYSNTHKRVIFQHMVNYQFCIYMTTS
jgi:hypothetical protein